MPGTFKMIATPLSSLLKNSKSSSVGGLGPTVISVTFGVPVRVSLASSAL